MNGSLSCRARNRRSSWLRPDSTFTGAEKPRNSEGTGLLATPVKVSVTLSLSSTIRSPSTVPPETPFQPMGLPLGPMRPNRTGISSGFLVGSPGVGSTFWVRVSV
ncbi:hypothetical protein D3C87_1610370 [compost metagenome]